jgi:Ni,Fe-hydrogenase I small subunit
MAEETIYQHLRRKGVSRRAFMQMCGLLAGAMGLRYVPVVEASGPASQIARGYDPLTRQVAQALESKPRVPVLWLEFQDCAGCTEALTRSTSPTLVDLVLNHITVEYHETLSAAAGFQVEQAKQDAMKKYAGQYVLVVEGSIPTGADGIYCTVGGDHRHRQLCDLWRHPGSQTQPDWRERRTRDHHRQAGRQYLRLSRHPRSLHRHGASLLGLRRAAGTGSAQPSQALLRCHRP